ncbi:OLC1v1034158C1 [Oldenlandia corymbosa var. corymbosa]|uniref:Cholesterol oxidase n=1 Tax=Oldenlandia corymbosa var. corymbosa TaxID=529605 RepID=A0AAV1CRA7_OLDCO|nr:OLC1v1034158C1 [Oldenlandia corymbosa var. corymbosa]
MESNPSCFHSQSDLSYDAVVIGSGYGGSVAACRMSMAGLKVCLLEKGRKWEAHDFPANTIEMLSAVRMENRNLGLSFGSRNALYQIYVQDDSLAAMACGLGGGSLVNAGVMMPAPPRAKRNPKWPKEWEKDWEACEASASQMLRMQNVPINFPNAKIMESAVSEDLGLTSQIPVKLSVNFGTEVQSYESKNSQQKMDNCQACGNCLSGCPYNAKNSADKTYLVSAIQAGCDMRTECEVQYIVRNPDDTCEAEEELSRRKKRRWLVFLNEFDYIQSDFVVLSAGVFGTTKILFQSQMRGLVLSQKLGSGWSCNGNNVAFLARNRAPLNGYGLERNNLSDVPFQERPGPSISSSYISSLGFTIQSAVIPKIFPVLIFKGIATYGWPSGNGFLNEIRYRFKHLFSVNDQDMVLNVMGYDDGNGKLTFQKETNEIRFQPATDPLLPKKIGTFQKLAKKLGGILFMSRYRSTSVHLLGGCSASSDALSGVCNHNGQIFDTRSPTSVHPGLYVCDASLIPCSVGVNPSLTIVTVAEHVSKKLVNDALDLKSKDANFVNRKFYEKLDANYPGMLQKKSGSAVYFKETLHGEVGGLPCIAYLKVKLDSRTFDNRNIKEGNLRSFLVGKVSGYIICKAVEMDWLHVIDGEVDLCQVDCKTPYTQYMHYHLLLASSSGSRYIAEGKKIMNPFFSALYAWRESTTLHVEFRKITKSDSGEVLKGKLHVSLFDLLATLISLRGRQKLEFLSALLQSLFRTYISQVPRGCHEVFSAADLYHFSYPIDTLHEIETEDGTRIKCRQWKCNSGSERHEGGIKPFPVLLINGYSTESYCLPTEKTDLIRTLLQEGHETWLLQSRLHPLASSKNASIEDIGKFDVPAAIRKIIELHGIWTKVHVVAHCVGGLAMHIALMGGYVSCKRIASISCTNSSMFFKLTFWSRVKLWLPLIPISMEILGKDKSVPLFQTYKASTRQKLLKSIARVIPRYERCTCDECEVFSGIFGNTFWHQNVGNKMHYWLNKESLPCLPMSAFHHLRKICNAGFIVDSNGKNTYLIHPERMALPTLYLSGGRTLLVTPQTSFLANKFMRLHQPGFRHERVVIDGFGHSDLLIGEESSKQVFPHILSHVALAEKETGISLNILEKKYNKDALSWAQDPYQDPEGRLFSIFSLMINVFTFFCFSVLVVMLVDLLPF